MSLLELATAAALLHKSELQNERKSELKISSNCDGLISSNDKINAVNHVFDVFLNLVVFYK